MAGRRQLDPCSGTSKFSGLPCKAKALPGGQFCLNHGGALPAVAAAAERRQALAEAERIAGRLGVIVNPSDPFEAVATGLRQLRSMVQEYGAAVDELGPAGSRYEHEKAGEQIRGEVVIYQRALKDLGDLSLAIVKTGLDARAAQLAEDQATEITTIVLRAFDRAGLTDEQRQAATAALRVEFGALAGRAKSSVPALRGQIER